MSGFRKIVITTLIIASVAIGIGAYIIFESGLGTGDIADNISRLFSGSDININLGRGVDVSDSSAYPYEDKKNILLETPIGDLKVTGYDGEEIRFSIEGRVPERYEERYLKINESGEELEIRIYDDINNLNFAFGNDYDLDIELLIPYGYRGNVEFDNVSGEITIEGINAREVDVENISGDIVLDGGNHEKVEFSTISGQFISYSEVSILEGESISGKITATGVQESFDINSISGSVNITGQRLRNDSKIETISGAVNVEFLDADDIGYDLSSVSGKISVENKDGINQSSQSLRRSASGSATIDVSTVSGKISIRY